MGSDRRPSSGTDRILRAAIAAIRPRGHGFDQPVDGDVLEEIERFLPFLPTPMRIAFPLGLRTLVLLAFYQHPQVLAHLGVDWQGRAVELTRRRAELLEIAPLRAGS